MQNLEPLARGLLRRWKRVGLRLREPTGQIQRASARIRAHAEVPLADNLRPHIAPAWHAKSITPHEHRHLSVTYLTIITTHIRIRDHLRDRRAQRVKAVLGFAVVRIVERLAERDSEVRALLRRSEREELSDLEPGEARRARVARKDGAVRDRRDLLDRILE